MASSSNAQITFEDGDQEEELEHFDDFTLASSWERFISEIEAICRQWLADGPNNLLEKGAIHLSFSKGVYSVKSELKYVMKSYYMEYYFQTNHDGRVADWNDALHELQLSFGVKEFLLISPQSANGVVLDAPEASKLLSAVAIAMSNCSCLLPAFVPVHDPSRRAYIGIQNMGTVFTRRFEADRIGSQVPIKLMHLEGLYELFVSKFAFSMLDPTMHLFKVHFTMKLTFKTLSYDDDDGSPIAEAISESDGHLGSEIRSKAQWDDDCPWSEWYSAEDPIKGFELIALWSEKTVETSLDMAEMENAPPIEAEKWFLRPNLSSYLDSTGSTVGFASQLRLLINALDVSLEAKFMEDFVSVENAGSDNPNSLAVIPPPTVLDRVLRDIFNEGVKLDFSKSEQRSSRAVKGAPLECIFALFCLHALWFGNCNIRAIAVLWIEFVREIRWYWEELQPLPRMPSNGVIDLSTCLVNQKLHMLAICIEKKRQQDEEFHDCIEIKDNNSASDMEISHEDKNMCGSNKVCEDSPRKHDSLSSSDPCVASKLHKIKDSAELKPSNSVRKGSAGVIESMMLLNSYEKMHAPFTQDPPLMTEDMHEERLQAVEALCDTFNFSAQLEREVLLSDMSAFKAANPNAAFEDFIRWHSPRDWEDDVIEENGECQSGLLARAASVWPPRGRLSARMSEGGNAWRKIWNEAPPLPADEQKPLLDPNREGEKVLHYLETLRPHQLLEQMVCTSFRAAADKLNQTSIGKLTEMIAKVEQLYHTIASALRPLQANRLILDSEVLEDLRRLCCVFGHVEKLLTLAASLHRKFLRAPRLSECIFSDYYNFYLPKMGKGSTERDVNKGFEKQQLVRINEREAVASMFVQPTANQSWRKVLSMGNLLNGHEPMLREIIFSMRDRVCGAYYSTNSPADYRHEIETYRMYICGTSNDLRVALSVASCD